MNTDLWNKLEAFSFDSPEVDFPFSERLRRENGWTAEYTTRVIQEYRRFLYLCVEAGHPVTPSDEVDQAWHLHLCYTRSYWDDLCRDTLGQPVHHGPTRGGKAEGAKFSDWYDATRNSYTSHFGKLPPDDIWPVSERRFKEADWMRVNRSENLVFSKGIVRLTAVCLLVGIFTAGCRWNEGEVGMLIFLAFIATFAVIFFIAASRGGGGKGGGKGGSGCGGGWFGGGCSNDGGCGGGCGGD